jgi:secondary thiamine-phosphate synthase enzyme
MIRQIEISLSERHRGFHLITDEILARIAPLPETGLLHLFLKHTSAGLTLNENADPDVSADLNTFFSDTVPESYPKFTHRDEGDDDMPAHVKSTIVGQSLIIPITRKRLNLGIWQGIYLCEFRRAGGRRTIVATIL